MKLLSTALLGDVDRVPRHFRVVTEFVTVCGVPTKPLSGWIIADREKRARRIEEAEWAVPIPASRRSLFVAYTVSWFGILHALVGLASIAHLFWAFAAGGPKPVDMAVTLVGLLISSPMLVAIWLGLSEPSADRVSELVRMARS